jgi:hypothetical protein
MPEATTTQITQPLSVEAARAWYVGLFSSSVAIASGRGRAHVSLRESDDDVRSRRTYPTTAQRLPAVFLNWVVMIVKGSPHVGGQVGRRWETSAAVGGDTWRFTACQGDTSVARGIAVLRERNFTFAYWDSSVRRRRQLV